MNFCKVRRGSSCSAVNSIRSPPLPSLAPVYHRTAVGGAADGRVPPGPDDLRRTPLEIVLIAICERPLAASLALLYLSTAGRAPRICATQPRGDSSCNWPL